MGRWRGWGFTVGVVAVAAVVMKQKGWGYINNNNNNNNKEVIVGWLREMKERLGWWAMPAYVGIHTLTLALCLPHAVFFEAAASVLFGFFPALLCVFSAKLLGASLSFFLGRIVFRSSSSAIEWMQRNRYFHLLSRGVERDGWRFVLLARFSPIPSYIINYGLAATKVGFFVDFLLPTVIGCMPMILQNTSIGSLAGAAVSSSTSAASSSQKSRVWSYIFPLLGILSGILISVRVKRYSTGISAAGDNNIGDASGDTAVDSAQTLPDPTKRIK